MIFFTKSKVLVSVHGVLMWPVLHLSRVVCVYRRAYKYSIDLDEVKQAL